MKNANVIELTDENFQAEVLDAELPTLVDFWAVWCEPCRQIQPVVDKLADTYTGKLQVGTLDIDRNQITPQRYLVASIPTLLLFKGGQIVASIVGVEPESRIEAEVVKHLKQSAHRGPGRRPTHRGCRARRPRHANRRVPPISGEGVPPCVITITNDVPRYLRCSDLRTNCGRRIRPPGRLPLPGNLSPRIP